MNCNPGVFATSDYWQAHDADLRRLVAEGKTSGQVAREMGVSRNTVIGRARRLGLSWSLSARGGRARLTGPIQPPPPLLPTPFPPPQSCLYPHGDPGDPGFGFCGDEVVEFGHPYCAEHKNITYKKGKSED